MEIEKWSTKSSRFDQKNIFSLILKFSDQIEWMQRWHWHYQPHIELQQIQIVAWVSCIVNFFGGRRTGASRSSHGITCVKTTAIASRSAFLKSPRRLSASTSSLGIGRQPVMLCFVSAEGKPAAMYFVLTVLNNTLNRIQSEVRAENDTVKT